MKCRYCGKETGHDEPVKVDGEWWPEDLCDANDCVDRFADDFCDAEPREDPEVAWEKRMDEFWEQDCLWDE